ncbi:hypothetical protein [Cellulomonas flavigena]|uniref:hypothetical protein n=1 Tax=Cellulomonas flavigena TaxID=1711 RepID=UPI00019E3E8D|nr:hypothetical protein [Cellulomonas flavigena]
MGRGHAADAVVRRGVGVPRPDGTTTARGPPPQGHPPGHVVGADPHQHQREHSRTHDGGGEREDRTEVCCGALAMQCADRQRDDHGNHRERRRQVEIRQVLVPARARPELLVPQPARECRGGVQRAPVDACRSDRGRLDALVPGTGRAREQVEREGDETRQGPAHGEPGAGAVDRGQERHDVAQGPAATHAS